MGSERVRRLAGPTVGDIWRAERAEEAFRNIVEAAASRHGAGERRGRQWPAQMTSSTANARDSWTSIDSLVPRATAPLTRVKYDMTRTNLARDGANRDMTGETRQALSPVESLALI